MYRSRTSGPVRRQIQAGGQKVCHELRVNFAVILLHLLESVGHDAEVAPELLGHVQDLVLVVEDVHRLGVGVEPHAEGPLDAVGDVPDKVNGVINRLGVEILFLVSGNHHLGSKQIFSVQLQKGQFSRLKVKNNNLI